MVRARGFLLSAVSGGILWMFATTGLSAQQVDLSTAAAQMATAINNSKEKTVAVFDFVGPGKSITPLGQKLAEDFSETLAKSHGKFKVIDRNAVLKSFPKASPAPATATDEGYMVLSALDMGWKTAVVGSIGIDNGTIVLDIQDARTESGDEVALVQARIPLSDELKQLIPPPLSSPIGRADLPVAGENAYSMPRCIHCPNAIYSDFAAKHKFQGVVVLSVVVPPGGRPTDITVVKALPGLTMSAIRAVSAWKLQPATDPNGNPAAVQTTIEVTFRLY